MIVTHIPVVEKVLYPLALTFLGLPLIDVIDYSIRVTAGVLGMLLTIYLIGRARSAKRLDDINIKIKELELQKLQGKTPSSE